ncbi:MULTISPECIES: GNAT family N-acetyltransferase [Sporosarcina]|uniref:GNAT family N-acetyltransferase n=1 Tax=Sporosarcina TaxID=1569 RepID=UPI00129AA612|nr:MULTISPECIES: GNAT family N-acetyltransferase [Sporosarcina]GKV64021.1 chorismate synthase [Sporosarcina sp. NCCP-2331]GLB56405.1 chorismate synthase [Sporosarcina sp. NCCP-2378]
MKNVINISIRLIETIDELHKVHALEAGIWGENDTVPISHMTASLKNGGLIVGAFDEDRLIGFQYSFPGFDGQNVYLYSHNLGIHSDYRKLGIGEQLKLEQKQAALKLGYSRIIWTYDPLETVNANLNLHKLRARVISYTENAYGDMTGGINGGIPTDRFTVEWMIQEQSSRTSSPDLHTIPLLIDTRCSHGFLIAEKSHWRKGDQLVGVPVPANFQELKQHDFNEAMIWREKTREIFEDYLENGWIVTDLVKHPGVQEGYVYILEKRGISHGN